MNVSLKSLVFLLAMAPLAASARADETSDKIAELKKLRESLPALHLVATAVSRSGAGTKQSRIELWEKNVDGKQWLRRIATAVNNPGAPNEEATPPSLMVKNGDMAWREIKIGEKTMVFKGKAELRSEYVDFLPLLKDNPAKITPAETLLDNPCVLLEIRDKTNPENILGSFWISTKTGIVLKSIMDGPGETVTELKVSEIDLAPKLSDELFHYEPPAGAQVIDSKDRAPKKPD